MRALTHMYVIINNIDERNEFPPIHLALPLCNCATMGFRFLFSQTWFFHVFSSEQFIEKKRIELI